MAQIRANGVSLEYDVSGPEDGAPFLLIMGFGTQMTGWPDEFRQMLTDAGMRVIRFDNRDVGLSQKWDGVMPDVKAAQAALRDGKQAGRALYARRHGGGCGGRCSTSSASRARISPAPRWAG